MTFQTASKAVSLETQLPKPLHWILSHRLAVGPIPNETIETHLAQSGIKVILTLCDETEGVLPMHISDRFHWNRCVLQDSHYEAI